jgi:hypothetical protein
LHNGDSAALARSLAALHHTLTGWFDFERHGLARYLTQLPRPLAPVRSSVGTEVEGELPNATSLGSLARVLQETYEPQVPYNGTMFSVEPDGTIEAPPGYQQAEIKSPVLDSAQAVDAYLAAMAEAVKLGYRTVPSHCEGQHVHVGLFADGRLASTASDEERIQGAVLIRAFAKIENDLKADVSLSRFGFFGPLANQGSLLQDIERGDFVTGGSLDRAQGKGVSLNMHPRLPTAEVRVFDATTDPGKLRRHIEFCRAFVDGIKNKAPALMKLLLSPGLSRLDLARLADALGVSPR